jgi:hypothetical protein
LVFRFRGCTAGDAAGMGVPFAWLLRGSAAGFAAAAASEPFAFRLRGRAAGVAVDLEAPAAFASRGCVGLLLAPRARAPSIRTAAPSRVKQIVTPVLRLPLPLMERPTSWTPSPSTACNLNARTSYRVKAACHHDLPTVDTEHPNQNKVTTTDTGQKLSNKPHPTATPPQHSHQPTKQPPMNVRRSKPA